uniref:Uncharacterized protein n=1 Tax=Rhipicephalus pulchellus TaxID=72859 RepID=L7LY10_RHIPC
MSTFKTFLLLFFLFYFYYFLFIFCFGGANCSYTQSFIYIFITFTSLLFIFKDNYFLFGRRRFQSNEEEKSVADAARANKGRRSTPEGIVFSRSRSPIFLSRIHTSAPQLVTKSNAVDTTGTGDLNGGGESASLTRYAAVLRTA